MTCASSCAHLGLAGTPWARYTPTGWRIELDGAVLASCTTDAITTDEPMPHGWFCSGAADFALQLERGDGLYQLTGNTGHAAGVLVAQYASPAGTLWTTLAGQIVTGSVMPVT